MRLSFSKFIVAGACVATALGAAADVYADDRPDLVVAVSKLARSLDPGRHMGKVDVRIYYSVYDTLLQRDFRNPPKVGIKIKPGLAKSWKRIDGKTLEVSLRKGVTCHDGSPFNADDVLFTFDRRRLWDKKKSYYPRGRVYFSHLKKVKKVDDYTVRFVTKEPDPILESRFTSYGSFIVCDEPWQTFNKGGKKFKKWMSEAAKKLRWKAFGTGPYMVVSQRKNNFIKFKANDSYWGGKPAAKTLTFKAVPEVAGRVAGVVSGDFHMGVDIPQDQLSIIDKYKDVKRKDVILDNSHVIVFNQKDPVLSNKKLRQALSYAIDRESLRKALWGNRNYTPNGHQLTTYGEIYNPDRKGYVYDPKKAKRLVKESGYKGQEISFRLIAQYYLSNKEAAQVIQEMWRKVGINVKLDFVESWKHIRGSGSQIHFWANTYRLPDPTGSIIVNWGPNSPIQRKFKFFKPPKEFNSIANDLFKIGDLKVRKVKFQRMLDIFEDEMPTTILYNPVVTFIMNKNVNWTPYSLYFMDFRPDNFKWGAKPG
jgi:peptide/nickel transport system substrate-binding protein